MSVDVPGLARAGAKEGWPLITTQDALAYATSLTPAEASAKNYGGCKYVTPVLSTRLVLSLASLVWCSGAASC